MFSPTGHWRFNCFPEPFPHECEASAGDSDSAARVVIAHGRLGPPVGLTGAPGKGERVGCPAHRFF